MTYPTVPVPVPIRRQRQRELNPLRYHPMVEPVRIPEPVQVTPRPWFTRKRLAVGIGVVVASGFTWAAVALDPLTILFP